MTFASSRAASLRSLALAVFPLALAACGGGGDDPVAAPAPPAGPQSVSIDFAAVAGTDAVSCGTLIKGLGTTAVDAQLQDLRFYVTSIALLNEKEEAVPVTLTTSEWQNASAVLIDLENGSGACSEAGSAGTNSSIKGTVPAGTYTGIKLTVGLPVAMNHSDYATATAPLDVQALAWSWQSGRKFAQIEVNPVGGVARPAPAAPGVTFYTHLGATGCTGNPVTGETVNCARPDRMDLHFHGFDVTKQKIAVDLKALFAGTNLGEDLGGAPGCMSGSTDPECAPIFSALKIDLNTGVSIDEGHGQTLFRAVAK